MTTAAPIAPLRMQSAALSDIGRKRANNEDAYLAEPALGLYVVADGMGGHAAGEVASQMAVTALREAVPAAPDAAFLQQPSVANRRVLLDWLTRTVDNINAAIQARSEQEPSTRGMGCTLDVALVRGDGVFLAHVGDSRVYALRGGALYQLTEDHTFARMLLAGGILTEEEVARHPQRNVLTRALGPFPSVQVDTAYIELAAGDVFLLCSDGLYNEVPAQRIKELLALDPARPAQATQALVQAALDGGGRDNVTAVVFAMQESPQPQRAIIGSEAARRALAQSSLFAAFTPGELTRVQKIAHGLSVGPGGEVLREDTLCHDLFLVVEGTLSAWHAEHRAGTLGPGDPFGGMALTPMPADVTVRAESPASLLVFPLAEVKGLLASDTAIAAKLATASLERVARRLHQLIEQVAHRQAGHG